MTAAAEALQGFSSPPLLIGVTVLTSLSDADLAELGYAESAHQRVLRLAALAGEADRQNNEDEYTNAIRNYRQAVDDSSIELWRERADEGRERRGEIGGVRPVVLHRHANLQPAGRAGREFEH